MMNIEITRRAALGLGGAFLAGCSLSRTTTPTAGHTAGEMIVGRIYEPPHRLPPGGELVNSLEYGEQARFVLSEEVFASIAGTNVEPFNRITFRPRTNVPTLDMDLTVSLFGEPLFTPLIAGLVPEQGAYHADGEIAAIRGAAAANTIAIVDARSSVPLARIAAEGAMPLWIGVNVGDPGAREQAAEAEALGAKAVFVSVGLSRRTPGSPPSAARLEPIDWRGVDAIRESIDIPVVVRGILTPDDAGLALEGGVDGILVSDQGRDGRGDTPAPILALPWIADTVAGRVPVLVEGSFRRGSDVLKGLILGADAVVLNRPIAWALAAYGANGVQWLLEKMQTELARNFAMVGVSTPAGLARELVTIHRQATA